jgi:hypothetical protein
MPKIAWISNISLMERPRESQNGTSTGTTTRNIVKKL